MPDTFTTAIKPKGKFIDLKLRELWQFRDLIVLFVRRDFVAGYKQTVLGPAWYLIQPLITSGLFTIIFGNFAGLPTDGLPKFLFYMAGNVVWVYFANVFQTTSNTFTANANLFGKVYFPRLAVPVSQVISGLISFSIQFALFIAFVFYYKLKGAEIHPKAAILLFPILVLMMGGLGLGFGLIISAATSKYRDLQKLVHFGIRLLMYATPVIYPLSMVPENYRWAVLANPMTTVVETFRYAFLGAGTIRPEYIAYSIFFTILALFLGFTIFNRIERTFMDTV